MVQTPPCVVVDLGKDSPAAGEVRRCQANKNKERASRAHGLRACHLPLAIASTSSVASLFRLFKRSAPDDDDDAAPAAQRPRIAEAAPAVSSSSATTSDSFGSTPLTAYQSVNGLALFSERLKEMQRVAGGDGSVRMSSDEVTALQADIQGTVQSILSKPASTEEILALVQLLGGYFENEKLKLQNNTMSQAMITEMTRLSMLNLPLGVDANAVTKSTQLPADIIALICDQLRDLYEEEEDERPWSSVSTGCRSWRAIKTLSTVNKGWHAVCAPMYHSELHVNEAKMLPKIVKALRLNPDRAVDLKHLNIRVYDFEYSLLRSTSDDGFALPDLIRLSAQNLTSLCITSERPQSSSSMRRARESSSFDAFTGGLHLPDIICTSATQLRTLIYGAPCTMADVAAFTKMPQLVSLEVLGDVEVIDDTTTTTTTFKGCTSTLRQFWAPIASFNVEQLTDLVLDTNIDALGFTFDIDGALESSPPTADERLNRLKALDELFSKIGSKLKELLLMAPAADSPDSSRMRLGGPGPANFLTTITLALAGAGNPPPAAPAAAANPAAPAGPVGAPPAAAPAAPPRAPAGNPRPNAGGNGHPGAGAGAIFGGGGGGVIFNFPLPADDAVTPFFEALVPHCTSLTRLELYGRRYSSAIVQDLSHLPLEHLALSIPIEEEQADTAQALLEMVNLVSIKTLSRLELSGLGGDWTAAQRRSLKEACESRKIRYSSMDVRA